MVTVEQAERIVDAALAHGRNRGCHPLTVAVLDAGGHLVALKREDHSGILRPDIAQAKAWGALGMGHGSRALAKRAQAAPAFYAAIASLASGKVIPVPGGVLIRDRDGDIIGAVGVSGDHPDNDEACAVYAIEQSGLTADTGDKN